MRNKVKIKKDKFIKNLHRNAFLRFRWFEKKVFLLPFGNILTSSIIILPTFNRTSKKLIVLSTQTIVLPRTKSYSGGHYRTSKTNIVLRTWLIVLPIIVLWIVFVLCILVLCANRTNGIVLYMKQINLGRRQDTHSADKIRCKDLWLTSFNIQIFNIHATSAIFPQKFSVEHNHVDMNKK